MTPPLIPEDDEIERHIENEAAEEAELDRLAALYPPRRELPEDLRELFCEVRGAATLRMVWSPESPWHKFDRFDAIGCVIGGMGLVLHAYDPELDRDVAIKFWKQSGAGAQEALLDEAKTLARLRHPNVVTVYETGRWGERVFFVMEWVDGLDGQMWMETPRRWQEVRDVFVGAGRGLAAAHDAGIQHRDFKPANMLVGDDGAVVVADFGISDSLRSVDAGDDLWGTPAGTPTYMAPERMRGGRGDARSDQFSFCVAMWRALYGVRPYRGNTAAEMLQAMDEGQMCGGDLAEVPVWLREVLRKGVAIDPGARHRDMHALVEALLEEPPGATGRAGYGGKGDGDVDLGGPTLNRPADAAGWRTSRWGFAGSMALVCLSTLAMSGLWRTRGRAPERVAEPIEQTHVAAAAKSPCAGETPMSELDPVVLEVCQLIRGGNLQAADMLFEREFDRRQTQAQIRPDASLGDDARVVAQTFLEYAEQSPDRQPAAAIRARIWATKAASTP